MSSNIKIEKIAGFTAIFLMGIGIIQVILGETVSKSVALTANGIDCMGDGFVSSVVWVGLKYFNKPADHKFHFGYYKIENLASITAAIIMIILASYIAFRSYNQLTDPHEIKSPIIGIIVALFAGIVAIILGIIKYKEGKKSNLSSVKLEAFNTIKDATASFLAVTGLIISNYGYPKADAIVGFIIAAIILTIGFAAIKESSFMLVDACDNYCIDQREVVLDIARNIKGVKASHVVRLRRTGPIFQGEIEIEVPSVMTIREVHEIKTKINKAVKKEFPDIEQLTIIAVPFKNDDEVA